ncbi:MAG: glucokinase [Shimia sp.]
MTSLIVDIGGTNTRVACAEGVFIDPDTIKRYRNASHPGLEPILRDYMAEGLDVDAVAVCLAGPVADGCGTLTNLDWTVSEDMLRRITGAETAAVLNDLQAQGHSLGALNPEHLVRIVQGKKIEGAAQLVVNVGTGFNAAVVIDTPSGRVVPASESGHANLPIRTEEDLRLLKFVETAHGFPAVEDVLSGRGLERTYAFMGQEMAQEVSQITGAEIMDRCGEDDPVATRAVEVFIRILGTVSGNLSLIHLPFAGVYLVGGVARAMRPHLERYGFERAFRDKGRFAGFMANFSVDVVEDDYAALIGCASHLQALRMK